MKSTILLPYNTFQIIDAVLQPPQTAIIDLKSKNRASVFYDRLKTIAGKTSWSNLGQITLTIETKQYLLFLNENSFPPPKDTYFYFTYIEINEDKRVGI